MPGDGVRIVDCVFVELHAAGTNWKRDWYARGDRVTVDATPFVGG